MNAFLSCVRARKIYFGIMGVLCIPMALEGYFQWWDFIEVSTLMVWGFVVASFQRIATVIHLSPLTYGDEIVEEWVYCVVIPMVGLTGSFIAGAVTHYLLS